MSIRAQVRTAVAATAVVVAVVAVAPTTGSGSAASPARPAGPRAAAAAQARVLVDLSISRPQGLAVADDGTAYVSEVGTRRVVRVTPDGTKVVAQLDGDRFPYGLALADDGTLVIAVGSGIVTVAPDGTERSLPIAGAGEITAVDVDSAGVMYASDRTQHHVLRVQPDGTSTEVPFTGLGELWGIDVDDAGTISVVDATAVDVIQRTQAGVQTAVAIPDLISPFGIDITDGRMLISDTGTSKVIVRETDGTVNDVIGNLPSPKEVALLADGTAYIAVDGSTGCRCPDDPGYVTRVPAGGPGERLDLGDMNTIRSVAAAGPATALFTSMGGAPGYSDANPLRRVVGDGPFEDLTGDGPGPDLVDAAPDGTAYLVRFDGPSSSVVRRAPDGTTTPVDLPKEPGMEQADALSVDEDGRLFVAMGSGYGTGVFRIIEPLAAGGPVERYRSPSDQNLGAMTAGGGFLHLVVNEGPDISLIKVALADGKVTDRGPLSGPPYAFDADAHGTLYAVGDGQTEPPEIHLIDPSGVRSTLAVSGLRSPGPLSIGTDGTLYVVDSDIGLVAINDVGPIGATTPPPATPVPGKASFTG